MRRIFSIYFYIIRNLILFFSLVREKKSHLCAHYNYNRRELISFPRRIPITRYEDHSRFVTDANGFFIINNFHPGLSRSHETGLRSSGDRDKAYIQAYLIRLNCFWIINCCFNIRTHISRLITRGVREIIIASPLAQYSEEYQRDDRVWHWSSCWIKYLNLERDLFLKPSSRRSNRVWNNGEKKENLYSIYIK